MSWTSIIDQERIKKILRSTLERDRLPHAYLFSGPEGVGKFAVARELAKILNCDQSRTEACDQCRDCTMINSLQHPNVHLIFPLPIGKNEKYGDGPLDKLTDEDVAFVNEQVALKAKNPYYTISIPKSTAIKINSIREIRKQSTMSAFGKGKHVFIVLDADLMTDQASNAILKTLEEPGDRTMLILTTSRPDDLLQTIVSRCQHVKFPPIAEESIRNALEEREKIASPQAARIALRAEGNYSRALQLLDSGLQERGEQAIEFLRIVLYKPRREIIAEIDRIASEYERSGVVELLRIMQSWIREAMLLSENIQKDISGDDTEALRKFVAYYPGLDYAVPIELIDRVISLIDKNAYIPLALLHFALQVKKNFKLQDVQRGIKA